MNVRQRAKRLEPTIVRLARVGYLAKGLVFLSFGLYTARAAFGLGRLPDGLQGALADWANQPFGQVLLGAMAVGLLGYVLWLLCRAFLDADRQGRSPLALVRRAGALSNATAFLTLAAFAVQVAWQGWGQGDGNNPQAWVSWFLMRPLGPGLVVGAGLFMIGVMVNHLVVALTSMFLQTLDLRGCAPWVVTLLRLTGQWGLLARGSVFGLVGVLLVRAGWREDAHASGGIGAAMRALGHGPLGLWALGLLALGMLSLAVFSFLQAWYRRVDLP